MRGEATPDHLRLFLAATIPESVKTPLGGVLESVRSRLPPGSWPRPENYHVTFAFLGDQERAVVEPVTRAISQALAEEKAVELRAHGGGVFPNVRHARVGWLGLEPKEPLVRMAEAMRGALRLASVSFDDKPFHPHLTVVRFRRPWNQSSVERFVASLEHLDIRFDLDHLSLFSSKLDPSGAVHTELSRFTLASAK